MNVTHFDRAPGTGISVEQLFEDIRQAMQPSVAVRVVKARFSGTNPLKVFYNMFAARSSQSAINHVTGDAHYQLLFLPKKNNILTVLDCGSLERLVGWRKSLFRWLWYDLPLRRAHVVTVISEATKKELLRNFNIDPQRVIVIPCCLSPDFQYSPQPFNEKKPRILQVGTKSNKNACRVAAALRGIRCEFRIIGKIGNELRDTLQANQIDFSNAWNLTQSEVIQEYRNCDLLVFASTYEGFGLPIIEAQATGRPVVTSNLLSMPEVAGDGACLIDPYDVQSIRNGILQILKSASLRTRLTERGRENVKRFEVANVAAQYVNVYKQMAS